ncbi:MAG: hypothetical protein JWO68_2866 [Actinomycetia bacterium]|nr:hypothetical protein [Actinomycetes bacterium]
METLSANTRLDPRPQFGAALATAGEVVAAVRPDHLGWATPCSEYDVGALLGHLLDVLDRLTAVGRGHDPFALPPRADVADRGWLAAWHDAAGTLRATWADDATLDRPSPLPWAPGVGSDVLAKYVNELTVHTWDLAQGIGVAPAWDADVLAFVARGIGVGLPATGRAAIFAPMKGGAALPDPFEDAVPVPDDAPLIARIVAWSGRQP